MNGRISKKDDLISLGYLLVYLFNGSLPWLAEEANDTKNDQQRILEQKKKIMYKSLCKDMPEEMLKFFEEVDSLQLDEEPDYEKYKLLFYKILRNEKLQHDRNY